MQNFEFATYFSFVLNTKIMVKIIISVKRPFVIHTNLLHFVVLLLIAKPYLKNVPLESNLIIKSVKCVWVSCFNNINIFLLMQRFLQNALRTKFKTKNRDKDHWLDHANEKYNADFISDVKILIKVLAVLGILPIFWALSCLIGSAWIFQALQMNNKIGSYNIIPEQLFLIQSIMYVILTPLLQYQIYPLVDKLKIPKLSLWKVWLGGFSILVSFLMAGGLSIALEKEQNTNMQLRIYNTLSCPISVNCSHLSSSPIDIVQGQSYQNSNLQIKNVGNYPYSINGSCFNSSGIFEIQEGENKGYFFKDEELKSFSEDFSSTIEGLSKVR